MADKLPKSAVLYFPPAVIETAGPAYSKRLGKGAVCGKCGLFSTETSTCAILFAQDNQVSGSHGVCGLFVPGVPCEKEKDHHGQLSKTEAAYIEGGPTSCSKCEYLGSAPGMKPREHPCRKVEGTVEDGGCCNAFHR